MAALGTGIALAPAPTGCIGGSPEAAPASSAKLTEPGTDSKFGEVAYTHSNSGEAASEKYKESAYETKVTKIVASP